MPAWALCLSLLVFSVLVAAVIVLELRRNEQSKFMYDQSWRRATPAGPRDIHLPVPMPAWYVNLRSRPDRRREMEGEMARVARNLTVLHRWEGVKNVEPAGWIGCTDSHARILGDALHNFDTDYVLVMEDDAQWNPELCGSDISLALAHAVQREPWDVLMLSHHWPKFADLPAEVHESHPAPLGKLKRIRGARSAAGYIVRRPYLAKLQRALVTAVKKGRQQPSAQGTWAVDCVFERMQSRDLWVGFQTPLLVQRPSYSDLIERYIDYEAEWGTH